MGLIQYYNITCKPFNQAICIFIFVPIEFSNLVSIKCTIVLSFVIFQLSLVILKYMECLCDCTKTFYRFYIYSTVARWHGGTVDFSHQEQGTTICGKDFCLVADSNSGLNCNVYDTAPLRSLSVVRFQLSLYTVVTVMYLLRLKFGCRSID